ncbi:MULTISPECIES: glycerophosphodiester phosphodiesterase [Acetobacter]|jgi:glycerophosphoryl diester phosphodiesterase|uniref:glycerophosphodiester phosphodiesterase n=1 Tax=Acetobacter lovaniensis TaxID=104100 RepID=A0A841QFL1_9PROT|nr:glycerophosphodiester phosphodiesterase [Acetobacter lovaniensis]MBB6456842.1 glycerophosphoryl diester phosphodiesterase [Acetobacter lovaniensis]MCI1698798.1 glycerophosphodiester phosphodiesterase [Acetobacter lovaniensis]MCP1240129.1 glycerophosphodiester phosphodiesterase [Acetobacter lovaniensis]NHN81163.1 glycerophosphodiester phosphodiesterase [Acetobacter lovaniensis]
MQRYSRRSVLIGSCAAAVCMGRRQVKAAPSLAPRPLVFAHRGASALRPEHTLASYAKAIADGADYIEPDLVMTKDGVMVCRHESNIAETTDVALRPEFADRRRTTIIDGKTTTGWFTTDFTLAELKTLRAKERLGRLRVHNTRYDGHFAIPTFEEMIDFVAAESAACGRVLGLIPEIKHSTYFHTLGFDPEALFLRILVANEYTRTAPLEIQSFETGNLQRIGADIRAINPQARLMLLMGERTDVPPDLAAKGQKTTFGDLMTPTGLKAVRRYADVIGPSLTDLIPRDAQGAWLEPSTLVDDAHSAGLLVHAYTCRPENYFLPRQLRNADGDGARNVAGSVAEIRRYLDMGLDGFFTDDPAIGQMAVKQL